MSTLAEKADALIEYGSRVSCTAHGKLLVTLPKGVNVISLSDLFYDQAPTYTSITDSDVVGVIPLDLYGKETELSPGDYPNVVEVCRVMHRLVGLIDGSAARTFIVTSYDGWIGLVVFAAYLVRYCGLTPDGAMRYISDQSRIVFTDAERRLLEML